MLHFMPAVPNNMIRRPQRSDSLVGVGLGLSQQENALLANLPEELHDMKRVQAYGQEEDLKEALGKMIKRVEEMTSMLGQAQKTQTELETQLKLAKSNLQLALANNEMLEDALRRESAAGSKDVGWRRGSSGRPDSRQGHNAKEPSDSQANSHSRPPSRQGSASVQSTPGSEATAFPSPGAGVGVGVGVGATIPESPMAESPVQAPPTTRQDTRFFRFRFGSSSASTSPNPSAGPSSRPRTPPASAGATPNSRRVVDAVREREAAHLTSASLPSLVASTSKREDELVAELAEVRANLEKVSLEKRTLEQEVESLSQALFEEANKMVAQERIRCAEIQEELKQVRQEKEALKSALRIIEQENERLKTPPGPSVASFANNSLSSASAAEVGGEDDTTPHGSRHASQSHEMFLIHTKNHEDTGSRRSSVSDSEVERVGRHRATSSTRGFRERSSSSERGWASSSKNTSPSHASIPLPDSESESGSVVSEKAGQDEPGGNDEEKDRRPATGKREKEEEQKKVGETPTVVLTSPTFPDFPFEESPWTRL